MNYALSFTNLYSIYKSNHNNFIKWAHSEYQPSLRLVFFYRTQKLRNQPKTVNKKSHSPRSTLNSRKHNLLNITRLSSMPKAMMLIFNNNQIRKHINCLLLRRLTHRIINRIIQTRKNSNPSLIKMFGN